MCSLYLNPRLCRDRKYSTMISVEKHGLMATFLASLLLEVQAYFCRSNKTGWRSYCCLSYHTPAEMCSCTIAVPSVQHNPVAFQSPSIPALRLDSWQPPPAEWYFSAVVLNHFKTTSRACPPVLSCRDIPTPKAACFPLRIQSILPQ